VGTRGISAVSDAGPLIHLTEVDCLSLLCIFEALHISDAVWSETVERGRIPQADVLRLDDVQRYTLSQAEVTRFIEENSLKELHAGEQECLYLWRQIGVPILLTDDLAVRKAAKRLNLIPVGSLGIVVRAYRAGHISLTEAERHIIELYDVSSLFVTRAIVELAIEQLHRYTNQGSRKNRAEERASLG
jgi:predicted nucleic acid-binding protein